MPKFINHTNVISVPLSALSQADDGSPQTDPQPGGNVEMTLSGTILSIQNGLAEVNATSVNGQPVGGDPTDPTGENAAADGDMVSRLRAMAADTDANDSV